MSSFSGQCSCQKNTKLNSKHKRAARNNYIQKAVCKILMTLAPGVNIINTLHPAFTHADPKSVKKTDSLTAFFALLGYAWDQHA